MILRQRKRGDRSGGHSGLKAQLLAAMPTTPTKPSCSTSSTSIGGPRYVSELWLNTNRIGDNSIDFVGMVIASAEQTVSHGSMPPHRSGGET